MKSAMAASCGGWWQSRLSHPLISVQPLDSHKASSLDRQLDRWTECQLSLADVSASVADFRKETAAEEVSWLATRVVEVPPQLGAASWQVGVSSQLVAASSDDNPPG